MTQRNLADMNFSAITPSHVTAGLLWFSSISRKEKWALSEKEQCQILGNLDFELYQKMMSLCLNGDQVELDDEVKIRLSLLMTFHRLLDCLSPQNFDSSLLFNRLNSGDFLQGASIREYLLKDSSLDRYFDLKDYLETIGAGYYA
jgi:hypothetical protein